MAFLINPNLSAGMSIFAIQRSRAVIDNQWVSYTNQENQWGWENKYIEENGLGVMPIVGFQYMPSPELSIGAKVKAPYIIKSDAIVDTINKNVSVTTSVSQQNNFSSLNSTGYLYQPISATIGAAWFLSSQLLVTTDVNYYHLHLARDIQFQRKPIVNIASGVEFFLNRNISLRGGVYTNNSNAQNVYHSLDDINMYGITSSVGYETEFSSISIGLDFSFGTGKSYLQKNSLENLKDSDLYNSYDSTYKSYYLFFSGSYRL